ncbi:PEP/pyruvate-binding domain-containing protein [Nesterenkonia ebinurensis]|uniref:PEP/pyruvate-binding domain-containing protein n=1 Tax=Nesterenkonia ebinurensis TaxID=2608252 RepID=UPI00123D3831|nr:PEP/pyruvate-binding domain-containing protein [Nesterenkonia ebinurensis]
MLLPLSKVTRANAGSKATMLGALRHEGLPVPDGFVVPDDYGPSGSAVESSLRDAVAGELARWGDPVVAVRSSAASEDGTGASAAGQYQSIIGVRGTVEVCQAITACRESAQAAHVVDYWTWLGTEDSPPAAGMAVLVQPVVEAEVSGVMFTPQQSGMSTRIEASWGLGLSVVGGTITPDTYQVAADGTIGCSVGSKRTRIDLDHERGGVITSTVSPDQQYARVLDDATVTALADLGDRIARLLSGPQDVEWAVAGGTMWILQARPITAALPARKVPSSLESVEALSGTAASHGTVTAAARIVRGPSDFDSVHRGEIVVCPYTDPAWTPLFAVASGVVTETGGALSHAAIVAREYGIPAVLGVTGATARIRNGARITLNGAAGTISVL